MLLPLHMLNLLLADGVAAEDLVYGGSITAPYPLSTRGEQAISGQVVGGTLDGGSVIGGRSLQAISGQVVGGSIDGAAVAGGRVEAVN